MGVGVCCLDAGGLALGACVVESLLKNFVHERRVSGRALFMNKTPLGRSVTRADLEFLYFAVTTMRRIMMPAFEHAQTRAKLAGLGSGRLLGRSRHETCRLLAAVRQDHRGTSRGLLAALTARRGKSEVGQLTSLPLPFAFPHGTCAP